MPRGFLRECRLARAPRRIRRYRTLSVFVPDEDWYGTTDPVHFLELELRYER